MAARTALVNVSELLFYLLLKDEQRVAHLRMPENFLTP
jgi:hypothetical protein